MTAVIDSLKQPLMHPLKFWLPYHHSRVLVAQSFGDLAGVALDILKDMPRPVAQVCGSLTSGGKSVEENTKIFELAIQSLCFGQYVFNQLPFEPKMQKMVGNRQGKGYPWDLMDEFYLPIFQSGRIEKLFFLRGWEKSTGADWEHRKAILLKIPTFYLDDKFQIHSTPLD